MNLKTYLKQNGISQAELGRELGMSRTAMHNLCAQGQYPKTRPIRQLMNEITDRLRDRGVPTPSSLFDEATPEQLQPPRSQSPEATNTEATEELSMLLRKQTLTPQARKHFGLFRDPFADDALQGADDVFSTPDIRYVRESLWSTARFGGFAAVIGESGAGKSTLRRDLLERITRENEQCIVIEPYVLGMEDNDRKGKTLKAGSIADAIIATVNPLERPRLSPEARYRQLHRILRDSSRAGNRHLLVIEEAHGLPLPTLKHLKRFWELEDGFRKLLGIVLIGQTELKLKLSETNPEVREVTQRIELIELQPLDAELDNYLRFKFQRVGTDIDQVMGADGCDAIRSRLTVSAGRRGIVSLLYPLAVNNFLTAAMNLAASLGAPTVDANVVREV
ncbi:MAG: AAA family ATPase [Thiothrix sp.]|nr:AAA family ATPase [Thiothrix sp.]